MDPFIGEIRLFGGTFAPVGWASCNGQLLSIAENDALFVLLGTTFGGDGQQTFGLPDLRGRVPLHISSQYPQGHLAGTESVTLTSQQLPGHTHALLATQSAGTTASPTGNLLAASNVVKPYRATTANGTLAGSSITVQGGNQPHDNMMPTLAVSYIIATQGIFPTQN